VPRSGVGGQGPGSLPCESAAVEADETCHARDRAARKALLGGTYYTLIAASRTTHVPIRALESAVARGLLPLAEPREILVHGPDLALHLQRRALRALRQASRIVGGGTPGATPRR